MPWTPYLQFPDVPDADDGDMEQPPSSASRKGPSTRNFKFFIFLQIVKPYKSSTGSVTPVSKQEPKVKKERKRNLTGEDSPNRGPALGNRIQRGVYKAEVKIVNIRFL